MTRRQFDTVMCILSLLIPAQHIAAQAGSSSSGGTPSTAQITNASSGTYSIEGEILTYKSLQMNSHAIALDVKTALGDPKPGIVLVPSASTILPAFQLWRANMLVTQSFIDQADKVVSPVAKGPCPALLAPPPGKLAAFSAYATGVTQGVGVLQSILSLFASGQTAAGLQGTAQDQALMIAVARELRMQGVNVLAPDILAPWTIDSGWPSSPRSPFIENLEMLIDRLYILQNAYQCDQLTIANAAQLTAQESAREADFASMGSASLTGPKRTAVTSDIDNLTERIKYLRQKIGLNTGGGSAAAIAEAAIKKDEQALNGTDSTKWPNAIADVNTQDSNVKSDETNLLNAATLAASEAQGIAAGISGYLSALTGSAVTVAAPAPPAPQAPAPGSPTPAPAPQPAAPSMSPIPPILTILQADGLAREMGVNATDPHVWGADKWRILFVKSTESGTTIETKSKFLSTDLRFDGGAVSGYALFQLNGSLVCSGNAAAYGGYITPENFAANKNVNINPMLSLSGGCAPASAATVTDQPQTTNPPPDSKNEPPKKKHW